MAQTNQEENKTTNPLSLAMKPKPDDSSTIFNQANEPSPYWPQSTVPFFPLWPLLLTLSLLSDRSSSGVPTFSPQAALSPPTTGSSSTMGLAVPPPTWPKSATILPLWEVARMDDLIRVHVPFSLSKLLQIKKEIGSYTANSHSSIKEFQYITQTYNHTFHDVYMALCNNLLPGECRGVWAQAGT